MILTLLFNIILWWVSITFLDGDCTVALLVTMFSIFYIVDTFKSKN